MKLTRIALKLAIPRHSLTYWRNIGLLSSNEKKGELNFIDLVRARFIYLCRKRGISLQALRQSAKHLPAWQHHLILYQDHILANREEGRLVESRGRQMLLDFPHASDAHKEKENGKPPRLSLPVSIESKFSMQKKERLLSDLEVRYEKASESQNQLEMERILKKTIDLGIEEQLSCAWIELGNLYFSQQKLKKSRYAYECALELDPACVESLYNLANLHFKEKHYAVSIRYFQKCIELKPDFMEVYYNLGLVFYNLKCFQEAIELLESYLHFDPQSSWADQARQIIEDAYSALSAPSS